VNEQVERFQLEGNAPDLYEAGKVPGLFQPLAEMTLDQVAIRPDDRILDVACGTGIVARLAAPHLGPDGAITGIDLNGGMLAKARSLDIPAGVSVDWQEADVTDLQFDDGAFTLALCQQGLQFFPDKPAALAEIRRVLAPGGRLALSVWCNVSDYIAALSEALGVHVSEKAATQARGPFTFDNRDEIEGLVHDAGFVEVSTSVLEVPRRLGPGNDAIAQDMAGTPYTAELAAAGDAAVARVVQAVALKIAPYAEGPADAPTYTVPQNAHLVQAVAG
jgi:SAM-dependent methyltransferase